MNDTVEITFDVNDKTHTLSGIPTRVWEQFCTQARVLFPDKGEDAWSSFLAEFIMAQSANKVNHLLTDIPPEVAAALDKNLSAIELDWPSLHSYVLSASASGHLELARMSEGGPGMVIIIGIPATTLKRFPTKTEGVHAAEAFGMLLLGMGTGDFQWQVDVKDKPPE